MQSSQQTPESPEPPDAQSTEVETLSAERQPLPESPKDLLELIGSDSKEAVRRRAFASLAKKVRKSDGLLIELAETVDADSSLAIRWSLGEFLWSTDLKGRADATRERVASLLPADVFAVASRVLRSVWISRSGTRPEVAVPEPHTRLDYHPLLMVGAQGEWPPAGNDLSDAGQLFAGGFDDQLLELSALNLPLAYELVARRGLLAVRAPRADVEKIAANALEAAVKVLKNSVAAIRAAFGRDGLTAAALEPLLTLPRFAGRSPDLWAKLDKQRAELAKTAPADHARAVLWAEAMGVMPATSTAVTAAIREIPDASLMALLEVALVLNQQSLRANIQDFVLERARVGSASARFWQRLAEIAPLSSNLDAWWRKYLAPLAPAGVVQFDDRTTLDLFVADVQRADVQQLLDAQVTERIGSLPPNDHLRGTALVLHRLQRALPELRDREFAELTLTLRADLQGVESLRRQCELLFGVVPVDIDEAMTVAVAEISSDLSELASAQKRIQVTADAKVTARRAPDVTNIVQALYAVERIKDEREQSAMMARLREHLVWMANESPQQLAPVASELNALPPEALGIVIGVALSQRVSALLEAISAALPKASAMQVIWGASLNSRADMLAEGLPLPDTLASRSGDLLRTEVRATQQSIRDWQSGRPLQDFRKRSSIARGNLKSALEWKLQQFDTVVRQF